MRNAAVEGAAQHALEEREELVDVRQHLHRLAVVLVEDVLLVADADAGPVVGGDAVGVGVSVRPRAPGSGASDARARGMRGG